MLFEVARGGFLEPTLLFRAPRDAGTFALPAFDNYVSAHVKLLGTSSPRTPRHFNIIEDRRVYQALHIV